MRTFAAAGSTSEAELQTPDQMNFGLAAFASPVLVNWKPRVAVSSMSVADIGWFWPVANRPKASPGVLVVPVPVVAAEQATPVVAEIADRNPDPQPNHE